VLDVPSLTIPRWKMPTSERWQSSKIPRKRCKSRAATGRTKWTLRPWCKRTSNTPRPEREKSSDEPRLLQLPLARMFPRTAAACPPRPWRRRPSRHNHGQFQVSLGQPFIRPRPKVPSDTSTAIYRWTTTSLVVEPWGMDTTLWKPKTPTKSSIFGSRNERVTRGANSKLLTA